MLEYPHTFIRIFKTIWLIVHPQDRKNILQRFYFTYLNYCPTIKVRSKLTCLKKKKKKSCSIPFTLPLAPEVLPLPSYGFF